MDYISNRRAVASGFIQINQYCDVCGRSNVKVYAFECAGDETTHMYCALCARVVVKALTLFIDYETSNINAREEA